jgi:hypothetical protein
VDARLLRQSSDGVQGLAQKRRVVAVCGGGDDSERDAFGVPGVWLFRSSERSASETSQPFRRRSLDRK